MRQILIVNNLADQRFKPFFEKVFATVPVGTVWEHYENIWNGKPGLESFQKSLHASDAIFLILNRDLQTLSNSRGWAFGTPGFTEGKDVWVFEHCEDMKRISLRVPGLKHHVAFYITNAWNEYVLRIAEAIAEDKRTPLPAAQQDLPSPATLALAFNGTSGMALFDHSTSRATGNQCACPQCAAVYDLHSPSDLRVVRCRVCGSFFEVKIPSQTPIASEAGFL